MINNYTYDANKSFNQVNQSSIKTGLSKYTYSVIGGTKAPKKTIKVGDSKANNLSVHNVTLCLDYHFKLSIDKLNVDPNMSLAKSSGSEIFLPIESMSIKPISIESERLNVGIFADLPIISKRKVGSLSVVLLDNSSNDYEDAVMSWFGECCTASGYVTPLFNLLARAHYVEYNHAGKVAKDYSFYVIPDGDVNLSRNYSNGFKKIEFSTLIIGSIQNGSASSESEISHGAVILDNEQVNYW